MWEGVLGGVGWGLWIINTRVGICEYSGEGGGETSPWLQAEQEELVVVWEQIPLCAVCAAERAENELDFIL